MTTSSSDDNPYAAPMAAGAASRLKSDDALPMFAYVMAALAGLQMVVAVLAATVGVLLFWVDDRSILPNALSAFLLSLVSPPVAIGLGWATARLSLRLQRRKYRIRQQRQLSGGDR